MAKDRPEYPGDKRDNPSLPDEPQNPGSPVAQHFHDNFGKTAPAKGVKGAPGPAGGGTRAPKANNVTGPASDGGCWLKDKKDLA